VLVCIGMKAENAPAKLRHPESSTGRRWHRRMAAPAKLLSCLLAIEGSR
jgi:hypothetical protein